MEPEFVERLEDMSPTGRLQLCKERDGDMILIITQTHNSMTDQKLDRPIMAQVQFCTFAGGGRSHETIKALWKLLEAMKKDEKENPQTFRKKAKGI